MAKKKVAAKKKAAPKKAKAPPPEPAAVAEAPAKALFERYSENHDHSLVLEFAEPVDVRVFLDGSEIIPKQDGAWVFIRCNPGQLKVEADADPVSVSDWVP